MSLGVGPSGLIWMLLLWLGAVVLVAWLIFARTRPSRSRTLVAALALVGVLALPIVAWVFATPMGMANFGPVMMAEVDMAEVESEFEYLAQMIPHHEEAIVSARVLLEGTERPEMRLFAESILETQSAEVTQMEEWLAAWYPGRDASVEYEPMMRDLGGLSGDELDRAFLEDMIPHHMGAVMMSQQLLSQGLSEHTDLPPFAGKIRDAQIAEMSQMRDWLREWFGATPRGGRM